MSQAVVGVDIAKQKFDVARWCEGKYRHKKFDNTPQGFAEFSAWLATFGEAKPWICLEATGAYSIPLAEFLVDQGYRVSVVNPAKIHAFAKSELSRTKTDKADAKLIARFCLHLKPDLWTPPPPSLRELPALLRRVEHLLEMRQMEKNRLATANPRIVQSIEAVLELLDKELKATREQIRRQIDNDPDLQRRRDLLDSIPGLGAATIAHLLVVLSDPFGFTSAKQAVAYVGLDPALQESGNWVGQTRLSKTGDPLVRKILYLPALVAWRHNPVLRTFCERLKANGKNGKAIACAALRKLIHLAFAILKSGQPFDPKRALA